MLIKLSRHLFFIVNEARSLAYKDKEWTIVNGNRNLHLNQPIKRYMTGLDGLRAISVLAVIAYHLHFRWAEGGSAGGGDFLRPIRISDYGSDSFRMEDAQWFLHYTILDQTNAQTTAGHDLYADCSGTVAFNY